MALPLFAEAVLAAAASAGLQGLPAFDATGKTIIPSAGAYQTRAARFAFPGGVRLMEIGAGVDAYVEASSFSGAGMKSLFAALVQLQATAARGQSSARLTLRRAAFDDAPVSFLKSFGACLTLDQCRVGAFGLAAPADAHLEQVFINAGAFVALETLFDGSAGVGRMTAAVTGLVYLEASTAPIVAVLSRSLFRGAKAIGAPASIQVSARPYPVVLAIGDTGLSKGTSQYIAATEEGGPVVIVDLGGNFDADTGEPIDVSRPKRSSSPRASGLADVAAVLVQRDELAAKIARAAAALA